MKKRFKKSVIVSIFFLLGCSSGFAQKNTAFQKGEELLFKVTFGFFDAAEARMVVNPEISTINNIPTYKIDVFGQTLGVFKLLCLFVEHFNKHAADNFALGFRLVFTG